MEKFNIYESIAQRSGGDVYLGVVGPVRTGKSTFITRFMEEFVVPNIENKYVRGRVIDELPQSASGKSVMTTQPKFVPNEAARISVDNVNMNIRMVDCVGFMLPEVLNQMQSAGEKLVKTPWSDEEMPFEKAAEMGTQKVIEKHSNIAVCVTCDGSFSDIKREHYVSAEEKTIEELKKSKIPFVVVLNSNVAESESVKNLSESLKKKYDCPVIPLNIEQMGKDEISTILEEVIKEFPIKKIEIKIPNWMQALPYDNEFIQEIITEVKSVAENIDRIGEFNTKTKMFSSAENFEEISESKVELANGNVIIQITPKQDLFYKVLSVQCGTEIKDDFALVSYLKELTYAKKEFDKMKFALESVKESGYGVVYPTVDDLVYGEPEVVKVGGKFGVKLSATAPSYHIMQVDINSEINPYLGVETKTEESVKNVLMQFEENENGIWDANMFGKSMTTLVQEGLNGKIGSMPVEAQKKMRKTLTRIINEGKGGIICILL